MNVVKARVFAQYDKSKISVILGSDNVVYFKKTDLMSMLGLTRPAVVTSYKRKMGPGNEVLMMVEASDGLQYPTACITETQITDFLSKRNCYLSRRALAWFDENTFFEAERAEPVPAADREQPDDTGATAEAPVIGFDYGHSDDESKSIAVLGDGSSLHERFRANVFKAFNPCAERLKKQPDESASKPMHLIGITGPARAGKDTLADYLLENLGDNWGRSSFADPIKAMLRVIRVDCTELSKDKIHDYFGVTPRRMMQTLGTEWGRDLIDNDFWVKVFARVNAGKSLIVPDVRFENEAELIRSNGILIHLTGRGGINSGHKSENPVGFEAGDIVIDNSRDLEWLYAQVDGNELLSKIAGEG
jgi:hypothetical protein